jgi:Acyl-CoA dehydrogenase, C-terminal domain
MMMDPADRALLASTVHDALAAADGLAAVDAALSELGWLEMLDAEPEDAVAIVFTALGSTNGASTMLDDVVVSALGMKPGPDVAVLLPQFRTSQPPGRIDAERCRALGLATARSAVAREMIVMCSAGLDASAVTVPRASVDARPVQGVDPDAGFHVVRVEHGVAVDTRFDLAAWDAAVAAGRRAVAHQIAGACRTMLVLARAHAVDRIQFGRPIAAFQAVRHRLADVLVAVEALEATLQVADDDPTSVTAALAKATAGRTARIAAANCQQVLAGIGFTTDHPFHHLLKRTMALEGLFGSVDEIAVDLGRQLLAARRVPTLIEL